MGMDIELGIDVELGMDIDMVCGMGTGIGTRSSWYAKEFPGAQAVLGCRLSSQMSSASLGPTRLRRIIMHSSRNPSGVSCILS